MDSKQTNLIQRDAVTGSVRAGFTLVELLITASLSALLLAGILSASLVFTKSGLAMADYSDFEMDGRRFLQELSRDSREASDVTWVSADELTLTINSGNVTYAHSPANGTLSLTDSVGTTKELLSELSEFDFYGYDILGDPVDLAGDLAVANDATKMIQVHFKQKRSNVSAYKTSSEMESARYMLRNKTVTLGI